MSARWGCVRVSPLLFWAYDMGVVSIAVLFWGPQYLVDLKRDHNFDNHPYEVR